MEKRKTLGQEAVQRMHKGDDHTDPVELGRDMQSDYLNQLHKAIEKGSKKHNGTFYIVVATQQVPALWNTYRDYFLTRNSCPTPQFDQSVFKSHSKHKNLEYLWTLPSENTCKYLMHNMLAAGLEHPQLCNFVQMYYSGALLQKAKEENGETPDTMQIRFYDEHGEPLGYEPEPEESVVTEDEARSSNGRTREQEIRVS